MAVATHTMTTVARCRRRESLAGTGYDTGISFCSGLA